MKKIFVLFITLLCTTSAFSQGMLNLFAKADDFFVLMGSEKYEEAYAFFDPSFQTQAPIDKFQGMWGTITGKLGKLQSINVLSSKAVEGDVYVLVVEGKFANDIQNFILAFNKAEKIIGMRVQPRSASATYINPAYADTTLYSEKEIYVKADKHSLVGILTTPKKAVNYPLVVLVHGSGPSDMDGTVGTNRPLRDLATGLASKGIASIRYVKRTIIYQKEFVGAFTVKEEVLDDAMAAVALARTVPGADKKRLFVLGHSLGGMLAPRIASMAPDLSGIILLAAPARKLTDIIIEQNNYMFALAKDTTAEGKKMMEEATVEFAKSRILSLGTTIKADSILLGLPASYWIDLNKYNQVETAKKLTKQRIFVAQGGMDFQVSMADFNLWSTALGKRKNVALKSYPDLNHLLSSQTEKGTMEQYQKPANVSALLIDDLATWIKMK
ncbi:fermentation-respiration switch protein FrsA (DUF1100 family) [Pedobacter sp. UYP24]